MRLRNKKTGEVIDLDIANIKAQFGGISIIPEPVRLGGDEYVYHSLTELNDDWEDYTPKEPLIKDKKIRKAVRAWAEANDITEINVASSGYELWGGIDDWCIHFGGNPFKDIKPLKYTIDELCGEKEE